MNILRRRLISRRTVLRGLGASLALPCLEIMQPPATAAGPAVAPKRAVFFFVPNGMYMTDWTPKEVGKLQTLTPLLEPLRAHRDDLTVLSGLGNAAVAVSKDNRKHGLSGPSFLTCVHPHPTTGSDVRAGVSVDQLIAAKLGDQTRLPSLELSVETPTGTGSCDLNCKYISSISWQSATIPAAREISPRAVFEQLFGDPKADRARATRRERSVLDYVADEAKALGGLLGKHDRVKLDEFLESVRATENRIVASEKAPPATSVLTLRGPVPAVPATFTEHAKLMIDLLVLALASDSTRVASLMLGNEFSNRSFPEAGIRDAHHEVSHHAGGEGRIRSYAAICKYCVTFFGYLLEKMKATPEGQGTLLDSSAVVFGCGMGDGNAHDFRNLPILLAGGGSARKHGEHVRFPADTPLANLYLTLLHDFGVKLERFADSTGRLYSL